ncbi:PXA domain-containing protein [Pseudozyma hubeiensis]|nr:PXA domain-containing protein [Pseudozyma hubeiensis]
MSPSDQTEQSDAASAPAGTHAPTAADSTSHREVNHANLSLIALTAGLGLALLTIGIWNAVLVVAVAMLLICNPWVRTLLELPSADGKRGLSTFDPARFLLSYTDSSTDNSEKEDEPATTTSEEDPLLQTDQLYALTVMPERLRDSSQTMIRFVVRDFVQGWYDNLTFAHPNFLVSAEANISHTAASIYLRSRQLKSANIAAEMLLTVQSVLLSSLRRRRASTQYASGGASSVRSTWPSNAARIDALRKAVRKLLSRNLAHAERSSPVLMLLLTEIVAKQAWQVAQTIGDPDFINQKIVEWAEPASETSLEAQTISPDELDRLKDLDTAALDSKAAEALQSRSAVDDSNPPTAAASSRDMIPATSTPFQHHNAPSQSVISSASRPQVPEELARTRGPSLQTSRVDPAIANISAPRSAGSSRPPRPRVTPPRKQNSSGPFSALGGFATGAFGALADAAERAVDVVGGTVDEFGNLLMVPSESSTRSGSNSAEASPRRRYALLSEREQDDPNSGRGSQRTDVGPSRDSGNAAPAYHLDMPRGVEEPPLPEALRQSMRVGNQASSQHDDSQGFQIPDTPERRSMDASASIVAPAPVAAALNLSSRDSFSIDEGNQDEEASWAAMHDLLSDRTSPAYEAFENFLEHPDNRFCAPNEGESLLRLHTQLNTLASIMEFATLDEQTFRADASTILSKALEQLPSTLPATHDGQRPVLVRRSAQQVLTNLEWCANMDVVEPLRENLIARLVQLHNAYLVSNQSRPQSAQSSPAKGRVSETLPRTESPEPNQLRAFLDRENRPSFSSTDSDRAAFRYEPRRKATAPAATVTSLQPGTQTPPRTPSVPPGAAGAPVMGPPSGPSRPMSVPPRVPSAPPKAHQMVVPGTSSAQPAVLSQRSSIDRSSAAQPPQPRTSTESSRLSSSSTTVVSVTDISANAESPRLVDVRTFEVMISVEGVSDPSDATHSPDGFVLVRRWHEFEQMDVEIQRQPRSSNPLPRLPVVKGRRSVEVCRLLEGYLSELLGSRAQLAGIPGAKRFFDRTRAGATAEDLRRKGGPGAFLGGIGKGIVSGVGMVGKQAAKTGATGMQALSTTTGMRNDVSTDGATPPRSGTASDAPVTIGRSPDPASQTRFVPHSPHIDSASSTTSAFVSRTNSPSSSPSRRPPQASPSAGAKSELTARQLDMILSSIFAVADEAFNLQGGWTLRRGMLRVLEQVVRTTYATSIVSGFNSSAASLNVDNFAKWVSGLTETMWPNGRRWGSEVGTSDEKKPRTAEEKRRTAEKAREIVVSYAPAQAGYLLGPGGKVACVKALAEVHATLMDETASADLGLVVVLKALDMASR